MKKMFFILVIFLTAKSLFSWEHTVIIDSIHIEYRTAFRIPYNQMTLDLGRTFQNPIYKIRVSTRQRKDREGHEYSNTDYEVIISQEYYEDLYDRILGLDFAGMVGKSQFITADGYGVRLIIGTFQNYINFYLHVPGKSSEERGTEEFCAILREVFEAVGLLEWLEL